MLQASDFTTFFSEVWAPPAAGAAAGGTPPTPSARIEPFPWQQALAERVLASGEFPPALDLPTGTGKTTAIDVALFALAARPDCFPRRIVLVVDRRIIVDQAADRARELLARMGRIALASPDSVTARVAAGLRACWGAEPHEAPFGVAVLRGGMPRENLWSERPDKPYVLLSTVDQVGSRLLFRGYGVSERARPIHAGLLGSDCLYLLDEVHLSVPFAETLSAVERWRAKATQRISRPVAVVPMSATRSSSMRLRPGATHTLSDADRSHPVLARRLTASKPARLELIKTGAAEEAAARTFAHALADRATTLLVAGAATTLVVVNRVDTARRVYDILRASPTGTDVALLTGRMRPIDRDQLLHGPDGLVARLRAGRNRDAAGRPLILVATQCIEAGADFDADALVTECASLDALRQRFGRLDRLGALGTARAHILLPSHAASGDDPIYGLALAATWAWLQEVATAGVVDFGIAALPEPPAERLASLVAPVSRAPVLLPPHLDLLAQSHPAPSPDPLVALWLHGPERGSPEVQIVWRADLDLEHLPANEQKAKEAITELLHLCPPASGEAMAVPLHAARAWLSLDPPPPTSDVPTHEKEADSGPPDRRHPRRAVRWSGSDREIELVGPGDLRPGDTLVVPSAWGGAGAEDRNWAPASTSPVPDLGDEAQWRQHRRLVIRLTPALAHQHFSAHAPVPSRDEETDLAADEAELAAWLAEKAASATTRSAASATASAEEGGRLIALARLLGLGPGAPTSTSPEVLRTRLRRNFRLATVATPEGDLAWVATSRVRVPWDHHATDPGRPLTNDGDRVTEADGEIFLDDHLADVARRARDWAARLGLPSELVTDLTLAGELHDLGKADPRFQTWLAGGNEIRRLALGRDLAKSSGPRSPAADQLARERSRYPPGARHELLSSALARERVFASAHDPDLVLHLVESHHGHCRSLAPVAPDPEPQHVIYRATDGSWEAAHSSDHGLARLDSGVADRFWTCQERYGWWGLALLETILRLADHAASREAGGAGATP